MNIRLQKLELIEWLVSIKDSKIIDALTKFKDSEYTISTEPLSVNQKKAIDEASII